MTTPTMRPMDELKIGPAGQAFGQLKADVLDKRAAFLAALMQGQADDALAESYNSACRLLRAAYTRVGLPYRAP